MACDRYVVIENEDYRVHLCRDLDEVEAVLRGLPEPNGENSYTLCSERPKGVFEMDDQYGLHQNMGFWPGWESCEWCGVYGRDHRFDGQVWECQRCQQKDDEDASVANHYLMDTCNEDGACSYVHCGPILWRFERAEDRAAFMEEHRKKREFVAFDAETDIPEARLAEPEAHEMEVSIAFSFHETDWRYERALARARERIAPILQEVERVRGMGKFATVKLNED